VLGCDFASVMGRERVDDSCDDNRDDSGSLNHHRYSSKMHVSCVVTAPARSWQCGGQGFESP
jgi:hypothetical protein